MSGERKRQHRLTHSKPQVEAFFDWIDRQFERQGLLPSNPFTRALGYARERRLGLQVFLEDPAAGVDELTPRLWKQRFAGQPLRSDLYVAVRSARTQPVLNDAASI